MEEKKYTPKEIRKLVNIPETTLRYYINRGLIDAAKDEENGYHYFDENDFFDLRDISYLRRSLDFSIKDIQDCFHAATPDEYLGVFNRRAEEIAKEIEEKQSQLKRIQGWERYLSYLRNFPDSTAIIRYPNDFIVSPEPPADIDSATFFCYCFPLSEESGEKGFPCYFFETDRNTNLSCLKKPYYLFHAGDYLYSMCSSALNIENPLLLNPSINWAEKHEINIKGPAVIGYFFRVHNAQKEIFHYDITFPLEKNMVDYFE